MRRWLRQHDMLYGVESVLARIHSARRTTLVLATPWRSALGQLASRGSSAVGRLDDPADRQERRGPVVRRETNEYSSEGAVPLPRLVVVEAPMRPFGRRTSQRVVRRHAVQQQACQILDAWNWVASHKEGRAPGLGTEAQDSAVNRAIECASLVEPPKEGRKAALSALLKATACYGTSDPGGIGDVATFETGAVSLPDDVHSSPSIGALCPASASHHLEEFESMPWPLSEVQEMDYTIGKVVPYHDQKLAGTEPLYARFVNNLDRRGVRCWNQAPKVQCSCFFVRKKPSASAVFFHG